MREFAPNNFFRHTKKVELLKKFFEEVHSLPDFPVQTESPERKETVETVTEFYSNISPEKKEDVDRDLATINRMATERGISLLNDLAQKYGASLDLEDYLDDGFHDRALFYFLEKKELFKEAVAIDEFYDQHGWKRHTAPNVETSVIENKKEELRTAFEKIFRADTRGRYCFVETYPRENMLYTVITFEDYPQVEPQIKKGQVDRLSVYRPLKEVYFLYTPSDEELQIKYRGSWQEREEYLATFLKVVFNKELEKMGRTYNLDAFKSPTFSLDFGELTYDVESWVLRVIDLEFKGDKKKVRLTIPSKDASRTGTSDMWMLLNILGLDQKLNQIRINSVELSIRFKNPSGKRSTKTVPFSINWKDTCSLGNLDEFERKANRILETSNIDYGFTQEVPE